MQKFRKNYRNWNRKLFLQIISGEKPVDYFDTFVAEWYANGGKVLTERVQNAYESGKN